MVHLAHSHALSQPHALPFKDSKPSLAMIGTITSAATASAHHQWKAALRSNPPKRMAER